MTGPDRSPPARPVPSSPGVTDRMRRQARTDTRPEVALRRELHRRGLRYRVHRRPIPSIRRVADIVFTRPRVAVFVDGCYWHGCPEHGSWPASNADFWRSKIEGNRHRDAETNKMLAEAGWITVRLWEHQDIGSATEVVIDVVARARAARDVVR